MIPIIDFEKRSHNGPRMSANDFDDFLMETAMELVDKYDLNFDWNEIIADGLISFPQYKMPHLPQRQMGFHFIIRSKMDDGENGRSA